MRSSCTRQRWTVGTTRTILRACALGSVMHGACARKWRRATSASGRPSAFEVALERCADLLRDGNGTHALEVRGDHRDVRLRADLVPDDDPVDADEGGATDRAEAQLDGEVLAVAQRRAVVRFDVHRGPADASVADPHGVVGSGGGAEEVFERHVEVVEEARVEDDARGVHLVEADLETEAVAHRSRSVEGGNAG